MRRRFSWLTTLLFLTAFALMAPGVAAASTYRWHVDASGNWNDAANWEVVEGPAGAGYPNLAGDVALIEESVTITIPTGVTITIGQLTVTSPVNITRDGTGLLVFDNRGEDAVIEASGPGQHSVLSTPIELAAHVTVNGTIDFNGISESVASRNVTITGGNVIFIQANTYTGTTTVAEGLLTAAQSVLATRIPGNLVVGDGTGATGTAAVSLFGDSINHSADVQVNGDGSVLFSRNSTFLTGTHTINDLTIVGGRVSLGGTGASLTLQDATMEGGEVVLTTPSTGLTLRGSMTATSTAAGPAVIRSTFVPTPSFLGLGAGNHDFTIADGPQAVDFMVTDNTIILGPPGGSLTKRGAGVMQTGDGAIDGLTTVQAGTLQVNNAHLQTHVQVDALATLTGTVTVGPITVASNGTVAPGLPVGTLTSNGSVVFTTNARLQIEILGVQPPAGPGHDRLQVTGTVTLGNALLDLTSEGVIPPDATLMIIDNDGNDPVVGTFNGLPEGAIIEVASGARLRVSYEGNDGNDVVLTNVTPMTYFLSEGATGAFFDEDVLIANPNTVPAPITMTFFLPGGGTIVQQRTVPALSRVTVHVDEIEGLESTSPSVEVRSDNRLTLAVERTMFWDATHYGGHTANSVARAEQQWLFAEGAQGFFDTYLLLANPNAFPIDATVTFLRENATPIVDVVPLPASARVTVAAGDYPALAGQSFGMKVDTPNPITAERAMYFASTPSRLWTGGHANAGIPVAATEWFHAEGASGAFFNTFILISNPQSTPATVTLRFLLQDGGPPIELTRSIPPQGRLTVNPAAEGELRLQQAAFSAVVTSNVPVVSERAMYWPTDVPFGEGHASSGVRRAELSWAFAEGRVGGPEGYKTYILLANPNDTQSQVTITFLRENGTPETKYYGIPANSRFNIDVGGLLAQGLVDESFGASIRVTNGVPIVVERSMYWTVNGVFWQGGTNAVAAVIP